MTVTRIRKWFWAAVAAGVLSFVAMSAAKRCAMEGALCMARRAQALANGASASGLGGLEVTAYQYADWSGSFDLAGVGLGMLMVAAWAVSRIKGEGAGNVALTALLSLLVLYYFVTV